MGAYLNKPITEKHSESGGNDLIKFAATSMQGWRVNQEDAHNCILDLENGWHLFAVYDGHGGPEVAKYTSSNFPKFFKDREFLKAENIVQLLEDTFVDFDDHLRTEPVMLELKKIANGVEGAKKTDSDDDEEDEDKAALLAEGAVPLEDLLKKYGYEIISNGGTTRVMRHITDVANEHLAEARAAKKEETGDSEDGEGSSSATDKSHKRPNESPRMQRAKRVKSEEAEVKKEEETKANGDKDGKSDEEKTETETTENGAGDEPEQPVVKKGKNTVPVNSPKKDLALADVEVNSSDDEDYKEGEEEAEDEEGDDEEESDEEGDEEEDEDEEEEEEDEDMGEDAFGGLSGASFGPTGETPGEDSGTTACVCIVAPGKVIVANAGDSRAVLSRGGQAVDLSVDHKPEDKIEMDRITKAGGVVNEDGRVNGGLNLSRALGDHCYKKNKTLPLREQMISALPDVKILETTDEDDFIVVACDGIWNSLESQQVIDFVKERLAKGLSLATICEEMCTACLADSTSGDGTGCDNMTVIIADLKPTTRTAPVEEKKEETAAIEV